MIKRHYINNLWVIRYTRFEASGNTGSTRKSVVVWK